MVGSRASAGLDGYLVETLAATRRFFTGSGTTADTPPPTGTEPIAWQVQSLLLSYPDARLLAQLDLLRLAAITLDDPVGGPLGRFIDHVAETSAARLATEYVATFNQPECCLFLAYGTRGRGRAVRRLRETYAASGLRLAGAELPDHIAVMLEYAAAAPDPGEALLVEYRAPVQLLRLGLRDMGSPWADVLDSIWATLPPLVGDEWLAVAGLAAMRPQPERAAPDPAGTPSHIPRQRVMQAQDACR
jgi:nitrate reductase delta subunit